MNATRNRNFAYFLNSMTGMGMMSGASGGQRLNASGTYTETDGATIGTFNGVPVYAKIVNGRLCAYTYDQVGGPLVFKPNHWLVNAGLLTATEAVNYSSKDPMTGQEYGEGSLTSPGKALSGGSSVMPTGTSTPVVTTTTTTPVVSGGGLISNLLGGGSTGVTTTTQPAGQQNQMLVILLVVAVVGGLVYFLAKKKR